MGRYWDNQIEIDNVGINEKDQTIFFIECKWSNKLVGVNILEDLKLKAMRIDWNLQKRKEVYILLSKSGFTKELIEQSRQKKNIFLIDKETMITSL
jgi:AAA+ ATPase superfamily predicted ATPase